MARVSYGPGRTPLFLVRPKRARELCAQELSIRTPSETFGVPVRSIEAPAVPNGYDVVLLTCKAYDLDAAIESIRPAVDARTIVWPVLNGIAHLDALDQAFGAERIVGGTCHLNGQLMPDGEIRLHRPNEWIAFGRRPGNGAWVDAKLAALADAFKPTKTTWSHSENVLLEMREKFVTLATLAGMSCLMRAPIGDIMAAAGGEALMLEMLDASEAAARHAGANAKLFEAAYCHLKTCEARAARERTAKA
jgi:2-dehydropantoate 2-reductase